VAALITGRDRGPFDPELFPVDRFEPGGRVETSWPYGILG
jgi:hypothetical protein